MKKIFLLVILLLTTFSSVNAETIRDDYLYFPGGYYSVGYNISKFTGTFGVSERFNRSGDIYQILFGEGYYSSAYSTELESRKQYRKLLFKAIFDSLYNEEKLKRSTDNKTEYIGHRKNYEKEIGLAKLRYDNINNANYDYSEIVTKLKPIIKSYFNTSDYKQASLDIKTEEICGIKRDDKFTFYTTNYNNNFNIKRYYLLGKNKNHNWGAPWYKDKRPAYSINKESDFSKIDKSKFFLKEVFPNETNVTRNEEYTEIISCPSCKRITERRIKKVNATELDFILTKNDFISYFKKNWNLATRTGDWFKDDGRLVHYSNPNYSFGKDDSGEVPLDFLLLGVNENNDVIVLSEKSTKIDKYSKSQYKLNTSLNLSLNNSISNDLNLEFKCKTYFGNKEPFNRLNKTRVNDIFSILDKKFRYNQRIISKTYNQKYYYKRYENFILKLQNKINPYLDSLDNKINSILDLGIYGIKRNENKLEQLIQKRDFLGKVYREGKVRVNDIRTISNNIKKLESDFKPIENNNIIDLGLELDKSIIKKYYQNISDKKYEEAYNMRYSSWYDLNYFRKLYKDTDYIKVYSLAPVKGILNEYRVYSYLYDFVNKAPTKYKTRLRIISNSKIKIISSEKLTNSYKNNSTNNSYQNITTNKFSDFSKIHIKGNKNAQISLITFCDLEGPFCAKLYKSGTIDYILNKYNGKVNFIFKHFPLAFHKNAEKLAIAAECVARVGGTDKYYEFIKNIYKKNGKVVIPFEVGKLKLYNKSYINCSKDLRPYSEVLNDIKQGKKYGVTGTPGNIIKNNKTGAFVSLSGAYPKENFIKLIDNMLEKQKNQNSWAY